jgi:hypothetical protein
VAADLNPEFNAGVGAGPDLLLRFELPAFRAVAEFDRSAAFLFANNDEPLR